MTLATEVETRRPPMTFGSVCSGIEAATVAWAPLGWRPLWVAEIDAFPCALLKHYYPEVPNYGDFTKIRDAKRPDVLVGGTPCQSFSVAGKRGGLDDARGVLAFEFLALAGRLRPTWIVFENVPGLLSSDEGRDFGAFVGALGKLGYGWAYRILDAQFFGLAQRRERLFLVGYLGDWRPPVAVLFEPESLCRNSPPSREARQEVAGTLGGGSGSRGWCDDLDRATFIPDVAPTIRAGGNRTGGDRPPGTDVDTCESLIVADTVRSHPRPGSNSVGLVVPILEAGARTGKSTTDPRAGIGIGEPGDPMFTLQSGKQHAVAFDTTQITSAANRCNPQAGDPCHPLTQGGHAPAVAFTERGRKEGRNLESQDELAYCLTNPGSGGRTHSRQVVTPQMGVRRLTPRECERLQGFPDGYTDIPYRGKRAADGPRYKSLGNSMAVPVIRHIGKRIQLCQEMLNGKS